MFYVLIRVVFCKHSDISKSACGPTQETLKHIQITTLSLRDPLLSKSNRNVSSHFYVCQFDLRCLVGEKGIPKSVLVFFIHRIWNGWMIQGQSSKSVKPVLSLTDDQLAAEKKYSSFHMPKGL